MRAIKTLQDAAIVLRELTSWKDKLTTQNQDIKQHKIINAAAATDPNDYVIFSQLPVLKQQSLSSTSYYSIPFSSDGSVVAGQIIPGFVVGKGREGIPHQVWLTCGVAPATAPLSMNMTINGNKLLINDLTIPVGQMGPVASTVFTQSFKLGSLSVVVPTISSADKTASAISIGLVVQLN